MGAFTCSPLNQKRVLAWGYKTQPTVQYALDKRFGVSAVSPKEMSLTHPKWVSETLLLALDEEKQAALSRLSHVPDF